MLEMDVKPAEMMKRVFSTGGTLFKDHSLLLLGFS